MKRLQGCSFDMLALAAALPAHQAPAAKQFAEKPTPA
jgi:hypothetical protein